MAAQYLVRFDDVCPTMDRACWARNEALMRRFGVKPIVAVVPDNRDPDLVREPEDPGFWKHMKKLQADGWTIGLHGFRHQQEGRGGGIVPLHQRSEFAGLPEREQREKLERGLEILRGHGLEPAVWVAPWHGFDAVTLRLLKELGIGVVSDGLSVFPYASHGMLWLPQQLWGAEERTRGVWTILIHPNTQTNAAFAHLEQFVATHAQAFATVEQMRGEFGRRRPSFGDWVFRFAGMRQRDTRRILARFR
jgi:predicted deacetylase